MQLAHIEQGKLSVSGANMRNGRKPPDISDILPTVRARGVIVPLIVRPNGGEDHYEIVAGRRRFFAAQAVAGERAAAGDPLGLAEPLPCAIMEAGDDAAALEASLIENVARMDAHEVEQWETFILRRAFEGLSAEARETIAVLSLADVALSRDEAMELLQEACGIEPRASAARLRALPATGALELFGNSALKVHDAVRILGAADLAARGAQVAERARAALRAVMVVSIRKDWSIAKLGLLIRLFGQLGDARILVGFATDELFHEMGVWPEIEPYLIEIAANGEAEPETRLWALDGLVFNDLREGAFGPAEARIDEMEALVERNGLGDEEWLAWGMKSMLLRSMLDDAEGVDEMLCRVEQRIPKQAEHMRVFRYNRALALFKLGKNAVAISEATDLIGEYYDALGITPAEVMGRNAPELRPLLPTDRDLTDTLKHLADTLDLLAQASGRTGIRSAMARIHAMKFYELAHAFDSLIRVGLDLVDEFVWVHDFIGARQVLERNLFPIMQGVGHASRVLETRALYAVVLAYCGDHGAAADEVARLRPYEEAMAPGHREAFQDQKRLIENVRRFGGPRQREVNIPAPLQALFDQRRSAPRAIEPRRKIGRNERCPCGSGRKFKQCHGR